MKDTTTQPEKGSKLKELFNFMVYLALIFVLSYLLIQYVGQRTFVIGESMENTLQDGDNLIVDKITYRMKNPERFDIIVFPYQYKEKTYYVKRIIGLPGETVQIMPNGTIFINGQELEETYGREVIKEAGLAAKPITLGEDEYFVLGDNRNYSSDSRAVDVGNIKRDDIVGRVWLRIYPFDSFGLISHR